ncbi:MAG: hypothetical protein ACYC46_07845 [Acidobacteriaceae bacterium]
MEEKKRATKEQTAGRSKAKRSTERATGAKGRITEYKTPAPKPEQCQEFAKDQVAEAWPAIVKGFVQQAKQGSYNHTKFIVEFSGLKEVAKKTKPSKKSRSLAKLLMEELQRKKSDDVATEHASTERDHEDKT